ncbi:hypothetical protein FN846DRAFT_886218 [Sphaerosporella brunnea]|uniref:Uncharacterized protein n=1 Tax=Sphaerosporella brunnea TaxID=1250544 RepID=A0A5J5FAV2_9PEZI|nr:hypothetical protein FN846DRAFT_886218 [Sphaerosporella brunnea]
MVTRTPSSTVQTPLSNTMFPKKRFFEQQDVAHELHGVFCTKPRDVHAGFDYINFAARFAVKHPGEREPVVPQPTEVRWIQSLGRDFDPTNESVGVLELLAGLREERRCG